MLPVAVDLGVTVSWRPAADIIRLRSLAFAETVELASDDAAGVDAVAARRIRHVVSENDRVRRCVAALEQPGAQKVSGTTSKT